jgi:hypothetical protein
MQSEAYRRGRRKPEATGAKLDPRGFAAALACERGFVVFADHAVIPLRRAKGAVPRDFTKVSIEDRHLGRYYWSLTNWTYVRRRDKGGKSILMHREVMGLGLGDSRAVDHVNRDRLDNRRENLRVTTQAQNAQNQGSRPNSTSKHRGVSWNSSDCKWIVMHTLDGRAVYGGRFDDEMEAARVARAWRKANMPWAID